MHCLPQDRHGFLVVLFSHQPTAQLGIERQAGFFGDHLLEQCNRLIGVHVLLQDFGAMDHVGNFDFVLGIGALVGNMIGGRCLRNTGARGHVSERSQFLLCCRVQSSLGSLALAGRLLPERLQFAGQRVGHRYGGRCQVVIRLRIRGLVVEFAARRLDI